MIISFRLGVGTNGSLQTLHYFEVTDAAKVNSGGGVEDVIIDVVEITIDECRDMLEQGAINNPPSSGLFGLSWFFGNKLPQ